MIRTSLLALALATAQLSSAMAQDPGAREQARELFQQAQRKYNLGRFEEALALYASAYEKLPAPELLFNIAQCHRELDNHERAIFFYEGYLRETQNVPEHQRTLVRELLDEERAALAEQRAAQEQAEQERLEAAEQERAAQERAEQERLEAERREQEQRERDAALAAAAEEPHESSSVARSWWLWTIIGVVVIGVGATAIGLATRSPTQVAPAGSFGTVDWR